MSFFRLSFIWQFYLLFCCGSITSWAQGGSVDPSFASGAVPNGAVSAAVMQSDGKLIIVGSFTAIGSTTLNRIARFNSNGTVDTTFNLGAGANSSVNRIALQSDGKILIAGFFTSVGGTARSGLARLNSDGTLDTTFNPGGGGSNVDAIAVQTDGKILVGGSFHSFNGDATRSYLIRLTAAGAVDTTFNLGSGLNQQVFSVLLQADGRVLVGGRFTTVNGTARNSITRLNNDGSLDATFDPGSGPKYDVTRLLLQSDGKVLVQGIYTGATAATSRNGFYRLNTDGSLDLSFNAGTGSANGVSDLALTAKDRLVLGGRFTMINGRSRLRVAQLNTDGSVDPLFDASGAVPAATAIAVQSDGKVIVASSGNAILRLLADGTLPPPGAAPVLSALTDGAGARLMWTDVTYEEGYSIERSPNGTGNWSPVATTSGELIRRVYQGGLASGTTYYFRIRAVNRFGSGAVSAPLAVKTLNGVWPGQVDLSLDPALGGLVGGTVCVTQPDGKLIVSASYQENPGITPRAVIVRLNPDGSLDRLYDAVSDYSQIFSMLLQPDGKLIVGGKFAVANGKVSRSIARFNSDGTEDSSFSASIGSDYGYGSIYSIARQPSGKLLIGGYFTSANGTSRNNMARLNADGSLDSTFNPGSGANNTVYALALDSGGRIVIGGDFSQVNGAAFGHVARLNPDGSLDATFMATPGASDSVRFLAVQPDDHVVIAGAFSAYNSATCNHVARLNVDGSLDGSYSVGAGPSGIDGLFLQADGRVIISGTFAQIGGVARRSLARLTNVGTLDPTFDTVDSEHFNSFCATPDGKVVATGSVYFDNGTTQFGLARIVVTGGNPPPPQPLNASVGTVNASQLRVTWTDVAGETGYLIERSLSGTDNWVEAGQVGMDNSTFTDSGLAEGTQYYYRIRSLNAQGTSASSDSVRAYTLLKPVAPTNFTVRAHGYTDVILTWKNAGSTDLFVIERSVDGVSGWTFVASVPFDGGYRDSGLAAQTGYFYRIRALNSGGDSTSTSAAGATTAVAGLMPAGSPDPTFTPGTGLINTQEQIYSAGVNSILPQSDGKLIVCGQFGKFAGVPRKNIARINPDGSIDPSFDPGAWNCSYATAAVLQSDGKVIVGGDFIGADGYSLRNVVRLKTDGTVDPTFNATAAMQNVQYSAFNYGLRTLALQANGKLLAGGSSVIRLNADGTIDNTFTAQVAGPFGYTPWVNATAVFSDGHVMISGMFEAINGTARRNFARLNSDGSVDTSFDANLPTEPGSGNDTGIALALQPDGKWLRSGGRYSSGGLARYSANGALDTSFTPPVLGYEERIAKILVQGNGKILVGGAFSTVSGVSRNNVARLNSDGSLDANFDPGLGPDGGVNTLALQQDGRILVGGCFTSVDGRSRNCIARLLGDPVTWNALQRWKINYAISPIASDYSDLDFDGMPSLLEYAIGADPTVADVKRLPVAVANGKLTLSYSKLRSEIQYVVEVSTDLVNWTTNGVDQGAGSNVTASVPLNGAPRKFLRLRIALP